MKTNPNVKKYIIVGLVIAKIPMILGLIVGQVLETYNTDNGPIIVMAAVIAIVVLISVFIISGRAESHSNT